MVFFDHYGSKIIRIIMVCILLCLTVVFCVAVLVSAFDRSDAGGSDLLWRLDDSERHNDWKVVS